MSRQPSLGVPTALAVVLALCWMSAAADTSTESGAPVGLESGRGAPAPVLPAGLDDMLRPLSELDAGNVALTRPRCDRAALDAPAPAGAACWEFLTDIAPEDRDAASIELESAARDGVWNPAAVVEIEALWNQGRHEDAIRALRRFEEAGARVAVGVSWTRDAARGGVRGGTDVRIGAPRANARFVDLDYDAGTGHVFSVIGWGSLTGEADWTTNISTDRGASWMESFEWYTSSGLIAVDAAVVGDWLYIGYVTGADQSQFRLRRCRVTNGTSDAGYGFQVVMDVGIAAIEELAVVTNADDFDNRIYCIGVRNDSPLRFAWDDADGLSFEEVAVPSSVIVAGGLSATWGNQYDCPAHLFIAYVGPDSTIYALQRSSSDWTRTAIASTIDTTVATSISAYGTNIICAFETPTSEGPGIAYRISYDCGSSAWSSGWLAVPDGVSTFSYYRPSVDARNGDGTAVVYQEEVGTIDPAFYRYRAGFAPGPWADPAVFSDFDVYTGSDIVLSPLSPGEIPFDLGAIYVGTEGGHVPYFDWPGLDASSVPDLPASASTLRLLPASPNPFREQTTLRFELPAPAPARLEIFDLLGRHVTTLLDEVVAAGPHEIPLEGRGLRSGLYVYRLSSGTEVGSGQLILIP